MTCSAERSEERTNAMVRAPVKGARMRSEKSESSRSTDDVGERIPSGAGGGKGKIGSRCSRRDRWWVDLTRFSGHITVTQRGVHNVEERQEIHERISVPDGTACTSGPRDSGAFQGIWSFDLVD